MVRRIRPEPYPTALRSGTLLALLTLVTLLPTSTGCGTGIGLGLGAAIGSASPRYEPVYYESERAKKGERVLVLVERGSSDTWVQGRYAGVRNGGFILSGANHQSVCLAPSEGETRTDCVVPLEDIRAVQVRRGTNWLMGMEIGAAIGVVVDVVLVVWLKATDTRIDCCGPR